VALALLAPGAEAAGLKVYMARGKGAGSILDDADYQRVFRDAIFARHDLTIDLTSGRDAFLEGLMGADIVYLSLHANASKLVVPNGDEAGVDDIVLAYKAHGYKGPALVIVTGCSTTKEVPGQAKTIPKALGITADVRKRAYIGFPTFKMGVLGDRYFRVFLAIWMKAGKDGAYPTLAETRGLAKDFIERMRSLQGEQTGKIARFAPLDSATADQFDVIGDSSLRYSDIAR
jgi:hypothetical protein